MGLFDKFRKKVREAASEVDSDSLSAEEGSEEALEALSHQEQMAQSEAHSEEIVASRTHVPLTKPNQILEKRKMIGKILMKKRNYNYLRVKMTNGMTGMMRKNTHSQLNCLAKKRKS